MRKKRWKIVAVAVVVLLIVLGIWQISTPHNDREEKVEDNRFLTVRDHEQLQELVAAGRENKESTERIVNTAEMVSNGGYLYAVRQSGTQYELYAYEFQRDKLQRKDAIALSAEASLYPYGGGVYAVTSEDDGAEEQTIVYKVSYEKEKLLAQKVFAQSGKYRYAYMYQDKFCVVSGYSMYHTGEKDLSMPQINGVTWQEKQILYRADVSTAYCMICSVLTEKEEIESYSQVLLLNGEIRGQTEGAFEVLTEDSRTDIRIEEGQIQPSVPKSSSGQNLGSADQEYAYDRDLTLLVSVEGQRQTELHLQMRKDSTGGILAEKTITLGDQGSLQGNGHAAWNVVVDHQRGYIGTGYVTDKGPGYQMLHYEEGNFVPIWNTVFLEKEDYKGGQSIGWIRGNELFVISPDGKAVKQYDLTQFTS